jgi:tRNA A-37 threonylcarbamoyl transferase component Bud32
MVTQLDAVTGVVRRVHSMRQRMIGEAGRMRAAADIAAATLEFRVPSVVAEDSESMVLTVEYVPGFRPLAAVAGRDIRLDVCLRRIGRILGLVHGGTWVNDAGLHQPLYHGDATLHNFGVDAHGEIVLLDWDDAPGLGGIAVGAQQCDVGMVAFSTFVHNARRGRPSLSFECCFAPLFDGYSETAPGAVTLRDIADSGMAIAQRLSQFCNVPGRLPHPRLYYYLLRSVATLTLGWAAQRCGPPSPTGSEGRANRL